MHFSCPSSPFDCNVCLHTTSCLLQPRTVSPRSRYSRTAITVPSFHRPASFHPFRYRLLLMRISDGGRMGQTDQSCPIPPLSMPNLLPPAGGVFAPPPGTERISHDNKTDACLHPAPFEELRS